MEEEGGAERGETECRRGGGEVCDTKRTRRRSAPGHGDARVVPLPRDPGAHLQLPGRARQGPSGPDVLGVARRRLPPLRVARRGGEAAPSASQPVTLPLAADTRHRTSAGAEPSPQPELRGAGPPAA